MSETINVNMPLSLQNEEMSVPLEIEHEGYTYVLTETLHPDMMWTTSAPYQKGALTQNQISAFNEALRTGHIPVIPTDR